jgi:DNA polymerase I-like protein with 3'-5' exonuclease and polymerase domains
MNTQELKTLCFFGCKIVPEEFGGTMATEWTAPTELPNLSGAKVISLDCETKDPNLMTLGPGGVRGDGYVIGVSIATDNGVRGYYPIRHEGGGNLEASSVLRWLKDSLNGPQPKVGANILYDLEWLRHEGITVNGPKWDVQIAEPLLDEDKRSYRLEVLAQQYCGRGKDESHLTSVATRMGIAEKDIKSNLWRLPASAVGPYGEADADLPLEIFAKQRLLLEEQGLWGVFELETRLVDVLLAMRFKGIPVDINKAEEVRATLLAKQQLLQAQADQLAGKSVDVWSGDDIEVVCKALGIEYEMTEKGNASFEGDWLKGHSNPLMQTIAQIRRLDRMGGVFIQSKILEMHHNGRIHPTFRAVRGDDGGTKGGRFASSNPNMQQIPARDPDLAPLIRGIFVPEAGCRWGVFDHSQQEPRLTVHYAFLSGFRGAAEARQRYIDNPATDYHGMVAEMADIPRKDAKTLNLGLAYGMGKAKMATQLGKTMAETSELYDRYHSSVPFIKALGDKCSRVAGDRGYIKTILGRHRHFQLFGPTKWSKGIKPLPRAEALKEFGPPVVRYFVHKAMNALVQGSGGDMIKKNLIDLYDAGYTLPLTIHDELDATDIQSDKQLKEIRDIMINSLKLEVPLKVDVETGPSWGECKEIEL